MSTTSDAISRTASSVQHVVRFRFNDRTSYGFLDGETIAVCDGSVFEKLTPTGETVALSEVTILTPTDASKMIGLWNNFRELGRKLELATPEEPLYFIKSPSAFLAHEGTIRQPKYYSGRVVFEGELGIVIGRVARDLEENEAEDAILGYTCVNDVTGFDVLNKDPSFAQWTRAKSYDTFGAFGPVIARGLRPENLVIRTLVDGEERQNYPVSDMIFPPAKLVTLISRDMTLLPGDVIACGTNVGAGRLKPGQTVEISIDGIGTLRNRLAS